MAKFTPSDHVERLEFDFEEYGGGSGTIPEPSTKRVNQFFANMKALFKNARELMKNAEEMGEIKIEEMSQEDVTKVMGTVDEATSATAEFQERTLEALAELCGADWENQGTEESPNMVLVGGSPNLEQLQTLPYRVMQAFSQWLLGEIRPKATTPGTKR